MLFKTQLQLIKVFLIAALWVAAISGNAAALAQQTIDPFLAGEQQYQLSEEGVRLVSANTKSDAAFIDHATGFIDHASGFVDHAFGFNQKIEDNPAQLPQRFDPQIGVAAYATDYALPPSAWRWELLPDGLIYRSYQAGPRESRMSLHAMSNTSTVTGTESLWDATVGGRSGVLRFGNGDPSDPRGWQLDIEGGAIVRLNLDEERDLDMSDFRFGVPLTYTEDGKIHYKFGYYHLSSHLGDEFILRTGVNNRINYVRDAIIFGTSYNAIECLRIYGEVAYAFFTAGGAEPWEFQFGAEYSRPGPTGFRGTPFVATNAHLREEIDFSGDWTFQTGWLWRGVTGSTFRAGLHYMNGKSTQYQLFNKNEEQVGFGIWYDF